MFTRFMWSLSDCGRKWFDLLATARAFTAWPRIKRWHGVLLRHFARAFTAHCLCSLLPNIYPSFLVSNWPKHSLGFKEIFEHNAIRNVHPITMIRLLFDPPSLVGAAGLVIFPILSRSQIELSLYNSFLGGKDYVQNQVQVGLDLGFLFTNDMAEPVSLYA